MKSLRINARGLVINRSKDRRYTRAGESSGAVGREGVVTA
jgi:hypothetical protein